MADRAAVGPHGWRQRLLVFPIGRAIVWACLAPFGRPIIRGAYRVPQKGAILILPNHRADVDPMLVSIACRRTMHFMAKQELFSIPGLGRAMRWMGAFPVRRGEPDRESLKLAVDLLKAGEAVCIFPEGQLTETGDLQEIKPGVALVTRMARAPVICLGLRYTDEMLPYGKLIPRFSRHRLEAVWGEVKTFEPGAKADEILGWIDGQLRELSE